MDIKWLKDNRPPLSKETATINGEVFPVLMQKDDDGRDRPYFRENRIVRDVLDAAQEGKKFSLNDIWGRAIRGAYSKDEMLEYYRLIGYALSGYAEIFEKEDIHCSAWCDKCGCYGYVHPTKDCKEFVKEA